MTNQINGLGQGLDGLAIKNSQEKKDKKSLGQDEFMKLMVAQMNNQDPTKPLENAEFLSQLAQFGTVNGITELQKSFSTLANAMQSNQALQASTMVGRSVLVPTNTINLETGGIVEGAVDLTGSTGALNLIIKDSAGQVVKELNLGAHEEGQVSFKWDGLDDSGSAVSPGQYTITAEAAIDNTTEAMETMVMAKVDSVTLSGAAGPQLNLAGLGTIGIDKVKQIQ